MKTQACALAILVALQLLLIPGVFGSNQIGYGGTRCSLYNGMQSGSKDLAAVVDSWALGYLSGINQAAVRGGENDLLGREQPDRVLAFIRGFCESNLDRTINDAADSYWYDFINR